MILSAIHGSENGLRRDRHSPSPSQRLGCMCIHMRERAPRKRVTTAPLRVLVVGHSSAPSGAELALVRQLARLRRRGIEIQLCLAEEGAVAATARNAGARGDVLGRPRAL